MRLFKPEFRENFRILVLVSMPEIEANKIRSRFDARYWRRFFLGLVSKPDIKRQKFSVSSWSARLNPEKFPFSCLEIERITLADPWFEVFNLSLLVPVSGVYEIISAASVHTWSSRTAHLNKKVKLEKTGFQIFFIWKKQWEQRYSFCQKLLT